MGVSCSISDGGARSAPRDRGGGGGGGNAGRTFWSLLCRRLLAAAKDVEGLEVTLCSSADEEGGNDSLPYEDDDGGGGCKRLRGSDTRGRRICGTTGM